MAISRWTDNYIDVVMRFKIFAFNKTSSFSEIVSPCKKCKMYSGKPCEAVREHKLLIYPPEENGVSL